MVNIENVINESDHKNLAIIFNSKFPKNCYLQGLKIPKIERMSFLKRIEKLDFNSSLKMDFKRQFLMEKSAVPKNVR